MDHLLVLIEGQICIQKAVIGKVTGGKASFFEQTS